MKVNEAFDLYSGENVSITFINDNGIKEEVLVVDYNEINGDNEVIVIHDLDWMTIEYEK